jgi:hypothetical protein
MQNLSAGAESFVKVRDWFQTRSRQSPKEGVFGSVNRDLRVSFIGYTSAAWERSRHPPKPRRSASFWILFVSISPIVPFALHGRSSLATWKLFARRPGCRTLCGGGRFNPIVVVDKPDEARSLSNVSRADVILPIGDSPVVKEFPKKFPHIITPFYHENIFVGDANYGVRSEVLDIHNTLAHCRETPEWKQVKERGLRLYTWAIDDPLADVFLMQFGEYPSAEGIHIDYRTLLKEVGEAKEIAIDRASKLPPDLFDHPSVAFISRWGLERHYSVRGGWDTPGFFSGDASDFDDLVCCWNLRASDIPLLFVDVKHLERYGEAISAWGKATRDMVSDRHDKFDRRIAVWVREEGLDKADVAKITTEAAKPFKEEQVSSVCPVGDGTWNGLNIRPPTMYLGDVSTLGVIAIESGKPKVSFSLDNKPFSDDVWFHTQHLVASLSFIGGLYGDEQHTLVPPFLPDLNEFYARSMHFDYSKVRSESDRIGLVIDACDATAFTYAMPVADLIERIFSLAGFAASLSAGGLIARQLISQLGGVDGARALKVPGVRRLLKTHGPRATFTKKSAIELIASRDPENPTASFKDYEQLYGGHHPFGTKLDPAAVFGYLVEKGLFRMGAELTCPYCRLRSWTALDGLKQQLGCEMCGQEFDATRQLVDDTLHYRRSGVLGAERNAQGAIPVVLTLQQFMVNLSSFRKGMYSPSLDLLPKEGTGLPKCEVDFVWVIPEPYPEKTVVIIGECKDRGAGHLGTIDAVDIEHLKAVAGALPRERFDTYIVLAKLCPFTAEEITLAKTLNDRHRRRAILLTARELEPYHFYERTKLTFNDIKDHASRPEDLANNTALMYFQESKPGQP